MIDWIKNLIFKIQLKIAYRKKMKQVKKNDPYVYK